MAWPRNWPILAFLGLGWCIARLPLRRLPRLALPLGWAMARIPRLAHVTRANLNACMPDLPAPERDALVRRSLEEMAASVFDSLKGWFTWQSGNKEFANAVTYYGVAHLEEALSKDKPIILLNCHMNSTELNLGFTGRLLKGKRRYVAVYRRPSNPVADAVLRWGRSRLGTDRIIPSQDTRDIVRELKSGVVMWFAPDLEVFARGFVWADFFGVPAATSNSVARFVNLTGAIVLPTRLTRRAGGGFDYTVLPPLERFPTGVTEVDANRINDEIAKMIRCFPTEYWWGLERFLHRPQGTELIYKPRRKKRKHRG